MRDYLKEMAQCTAACRGYVIVRVATNGNVFRCKPSVNGTVILYKNKSTKQYNCLPMTVVEWANWAAQAER